MNDNDLAKYIWHILNLDPYIPMSWGIDLDSISVEKQGLSFDVDGFKHTGKVKVTYNEGSDLFQFELIDNKGSLCSIQTGVYVDELTRLIDEAVEKTENYEEMVMSEIVGSQGTTVL